MYARELEYGTTLPPPPLSCPTLAAEIAQPSPRREANQNRIRKIKKQEETTYNKNQFQKHLLLLLLVVAIREQLGQRPNDACVSWKKKLRPMMCVLIIYAGPPLSGHTRMDGFFNPPHTRKDSLLCLLAVRVRTATRSLPRNPSLKMAPSKTINSAQVRKSKQKNQIGSPSFPRHHY